MTYTQPALNSYQDLNIANIKPNTIDACEKFRQNDVCHDTNCTFYQKCPKSVRVRITSTQPTARRTPP